jgi:WD40 repeat protein
LVCQLTGLHRDWVTKVRYISDLSALVTCSLDCTVNLCDPEKIGSYERFRHSFHTFRGHTKGVYSLDWSRQNSFIASCGLERNACVVFRVFVKLISPMLISSSWSL